MQISEEKLKEIIASHERRVRGGEGEKANLKNTNLFGENIKCRDLRAAIFSNANLCDLLAHGADLAQANLQNANCYGAIFKNADCNEANCVETYFVNANLNGADFSHAVLKDANLSECSAVGANFEGANLESAMFRNADLRCANLTEANIDYTDLNGAVLAQAITDKTYYQVSCIGSRKGITTYCADYDIVLCGCWNEYKGGSLEAFEQRIENIYGENGKEPNKQHYGEYKAAIEFFKTMRKLWEESNEKRT